MNPKITKLTLFFLNIVMISLVIMLFLNLQKSTAIKKQELNQLYLKKEDLLAQQQSLENIIYDLNSTLQLQINNNQGLKTQLSSLSSNSVETQKLINKLLALKEQQLVAAKPTPLPETLVSEPTPIPVTRAS